MLRVEILWTEQMPKSRGKVVTSHKQQLVTRTKEKNVQHCPGILSSTVEENVLFVHFSLSFLTNNTLFNENLTRFQNRFLLKYSPDKTKQQKLCITIVRVIKNTIHHIFCRTNLITH
jgi:hypothetical protein